MGPNIEQLCRVYEPVPQDLPRNYNRKPTRFDIICQLLFTLTVRRKMKYFKVNLYRLLIV